MMIAQFIATCDTTSKHEPVWSWHGHVYTIFIVDGDISLVKKSTHFCHYRLTVAFIRSISIPSPTLPKFYLINISINWRTALQMTYISSDDVYIKPFFPILIKRPFCHPVTVVCKTSWKLKTLWLFNSQPLQELTSEVSVLWQISIYHITIILSHTRCEVSLADTIQA